jgi:hypothetical protein
MLNLKTLLVIILPIALFTGCNKENLDSYFLTAKVDGKEFFFTAGAKFYTGTTSVYLYQLTGLDPATKNNLSIFFTNNNNSNLLTPGIYNGTNNYYLSVSYTSFSKPYTNVGYSNFTITITAINKTYIEGSFEGILKDEHNLTDSIKISNGKFKVPFQE